MADIKLTNLGDIPVVEPDDSTHLLAEQDGAYARVPKDKVGGSSNIPMTRGLKKFTYDGLTEGRETVDVEGMTFVRVMDEALSADDLIGGKITISAGGAVGTLEITSNNCVTVEALTLVSPSGIPGIIVCAQDNYTNANVGVTLNKGVYVADSAAARVISFDYYGEVIPVDMLPSSVSVGVFVVKMDRSGTMDNPTYTADKTYAEITAAWAEGKLPVAHLPYMIMPIAALTESAVHFGCVSSLSGTYAVGTARVGADGTVSYSSKEI